MKMKVIAAVAALFLNTNVMNAQEKQFAAPQTTGGMPINEVVSGRHSTVNFDKNRPVAQADLGQLLWMTLGVNRPDAPEGRFGKANRTNPTAINAQEVTAYVFDTEGVWEYLPLENKLVKRATGDHRALLAGTPPFVQEFVLDAPLSILLVTDTAKFAGRGSGSRAVETAMLDAGIANQNLNLAVVSLGLATRPRMTMDIDGIRKLLNLTDTQIPALNNPIGYEK